MSSLLVTDDGTIICYWQGETPQMNDVIWVEETGVLYMVNDIVRTVGISQGQNGPVAHPSRMNKIVVHDVSDEYADGDPSLPSIPTILSNLKRQGF